MAEVLIPVFAGKTPEGEHILLYRTEEPAYYLKVGNDDMFFLTRHLTTLAIWEDVMADVTHIRIESPEWSGTAAGGRNDLIHAKRINV